MMIRASARRVSEPRPCRDGLDAGPDHGQAAGRRQADDGGVLHHVQRQARDGEEPGRYCSVSFLSCSGPRRGGVS